MKTAAVRARLRSRKALLSLGIVMLLVLAAIITSIVVGRDHITVTARFVAGTPENGRPVKLDTSLYLPSATPAPAVLLSQGFGGDKTALDKQARTLAEHGYIALAYSARGFGRSGGLIHFASPQYEVRD